MLFRSKIDNKTRLDWDKLRKKVKKGMRNATLMAIAPTANIGHVAGTTPGIDPQFAQIFSRSRISLGDSVGGMFCLSYTHFPCSIDILNAI